MDKTRVLFLCTGNSARSQIAEAFLRAYAGDRFEAYSAGLEPVGINPLALRVMEEAGIGMEGQRSKSLMEYMGRMHFGYLITLCSHAEANCPAVFPGVGQRLHWDLEDPSAVPGTESERLEAFRRVRDRIIGRIVHFVEHADGRWSEEGKQDLPRPCGQCDKSTVEPSGGGDV
ncbi:arsenate reductase ArsC [Candidatus Fermentibacteria bacterium]|nr:arsenate reductase ArsC [Candidatus Fermentibacteria bacterium]